MKGICGDVGAGTLEKGIRARLRAGYHQSYSSSSIAFGKQRGVPCPDNFRIILCVCPFFYALIVQRVSSWIEISYFYLTSSGSGDREWSDRLQVR